MQDLHDYRVYSGNLSDVEERLKGCQQATHVYPLPQETRRTTECHFKNDVECGVMCPLRPGLYQQERRFQSAAAF
jgi:hypothetical protein